jgi:hypothetical protein
MAWFVMPGGNPLDLSPNKYKNSTGIEEVDQVGGERGKRPEVERAVPTGI